MRIGSCRAAAAFAEGLHPRTEPTMHAAHSASAKGHGCRGACGSPLLVVSASYTPDPVEELRIALHIPLRDLGQQGTCTEREEILKKRIEKICASSITAAP